MAANARITTANASIEAHSGRVRKIEKSPAEKLQRLANLHQRFGRVDGGYSWLDIRLDKVLYPQGESPLVQGN